VTETGRDLSGFVEQTAGLLAAAGFPKMPARVLITLMASATGGLTAGELGERLGVSAAAVSGAVRYLQVVGMVHRVSQSGSRRDRYELPDDAWYTASVRKDALYGTLAGLAEQGVAILGDPESAASRRIAEMGAFFRFLGRRLPQVLDEWEHERLWSQGQHAADTE